MMIAPMECLFIPFERLKDSVLGPSGVGHTFIYLFFLRFNARNVLQFSYYEEAIFSKLWKTGMGIVSLGALIEGLGRETSEISLGTVQDLDEEVASCVQG